MYRKRGVSLNLQDVLDKMNGKEITPVSYSSSDILAAKAILDRLLTSPTRNEVSYTKIVPKELEEV